MEKSVQVSSLFLLVTSLDLLYKNKAFKDKIQICNTHSHIYNFKTLGNIH